MAYIKKEQYEYRRESAAKRNADNKAVAVEHGMSEEQAALISELCSLRHELHTNMNAVAKDDSDLRIKQRLVELNQRIREADLSPMPFVPSYDDDYIDIDDIALLQELGELDDYDTEYERIYGELSALNAKIENYLGELDTQYGTSFKPTGSLRVF